MSFFRLNTFQIKNYKNQTIVSRGEIRDHVRAKKQETGLKKQDSVLKSNLSHLVSRF